jgi:hypothetical protein
MRRWHVNCTVPTVRRHAIALMTRFLLPASLLLIVAQRTASVQLPEAEEMVLVGVALLGAAALLRRARPTTRRVTSVALIQAASRRQATGGSHAGRRAAA